MGTLPASFPASAFVRDPEKRPRLAFHLLSEQDLREMEAEMLHQDVAGLSIEKLHDGAEHRVLDVHVGLVTPLRVVLAVRTRSESEMKAAAHRPVGIDQAIAIRLV